MLRFSIIIMVLFGVYAPTAHGDSENAELLWRLWALANPTLPGQKPVTLAERWSKLCMFGAGITNQDRPVCLRDTTKLVQAMAPVESLLRQIKELDRTIKNQQSRNKREAVLVRRALLAIRAYQNLFNSLYAKYFQPMPTPPRPPLLTPPRRRPNLPPETPEKLEWL